MSTSLSSLHTPHSLPTRMQALDAALPDFLLKGVVEASAKELSSVRSPAALRVHAVDALKAMLAGESQK